MENINNILIIGGGIAGLSAAKAARKQDSTAAITILSQEDYLPYYRLRICEMIGKDIPADDYYVNPLKWYDDNSIVIKLSCKVLTVNQSNKIVISSGGEFSYDNLIIASGSTPIIPPIPGNELHGIHSIWTIDNIKAINIDLKKSRSAVVVGGGLLGLEAAYCINKLGIKTTLIEGLPRLLPKQLDEDGSIVFETKVKSLGIDVVTGLSVKKFTGNETVQNVVLTDDRIINADIVVISIGVKPNTNVCIDSNILVDRFISVNEKMQVGISDANVASPASVASDAKVVNDFQDVQNIYAAGDVVSCNRQWFGQWNVAMLQGQVAGTNAAGGDLTFKIDNSPYVLTTMDTKVIVSGDVDVSVGEKSEVLQDMKIDTCTFSKLVFKSGILTGGILIGEASSGFVKLQSLIKSSAKIENVRDNWGR